MLLEEASVGRGGLLGDAHARRSAQRIRARCTRWANGCARYTRSVAAASSITL